MSRGYQRKSDDNEQDQVQDALELFAKDGAREMLAAALEEEVRTFLGRGRCQRRKAFRGYRNEHHRAREVTVGLMGVEIRSPWVVQAPVEASEEGFRIWIVPVRTWGLRAIFGKTPTHGISTKLKPKWKLHARVGQLAS